MSQLTFGSLFAGIGGFDLGFERAGMRCLWQVEKDDYCRKVLAKHWPDVERFEDVKNVGKHNLKPVDVIAGGFPCQPHSLAGKRRGAEDDRDLWPEYRRIITELRPAYIVGENVPGIRTTILDAVLSDLENLNYAWQSFIIPACAVDAPHRRDRIFIVAYANGVNGRPGAEWQNGAQTGNDSKIVSDTCSTGWKELNAATITTGTGYDPRKTVETRRKWAIEPGVGRVANGVPNRVDRIKALGNAVVPQVAEFIGRLVVAHATA